MSKDQNPSDKACDAYFDNPCAATSGSYYSDRVTFYAGFAAGAASRDADVVSLTNQRDYEYVRAENAEQERDQLRAQIAELVAALKWVRKVTLDFEMHDSIDFALAAIQPDDSALREWLGEPSGWTHSCPVLCLDGVELWIDRCPHCGKPAAAPKGEE